MYLKIKIFLLFVGIFTIFLLFIPESFLLTKSDFELYNKVVYSLHQNFNFSTEKYVAPGYPFLLAIIAYFFDLTSFSLRLIMFGFLLIIIFINVWFIKLFFNNEINIKYSLLLISFSPIFFLSLFSRGPDLMIAALSGFGIIFFAIAAIKDNIWLFLLSALFLGTTALTDPAWLYAPLFMIIWYILKSLKENSFTIKNISNILIFIFIYSLCFYPWYLRNIRVQNAEHIPLIQKVIEVTILKNPDVLQGIIKEIVTSPYKVGYGLSKMFLIPPELSILNKESFFQNNSLFSSNSNLKKDIKTKELLILGTKTIITFYHLAIISLAIFGLWLRRKEPDVWLILLVSFYIVGSAIGYGVHSNFNGISPLNKFLYPFYTFYYAYASLGLLYLVNRHNNKLVKFRLNK